MVAHSLICYLNTAGLAKHGDNATMPKLVWGQVGARAKNGFLNLFQNPFDTLFQFLMLFKFKINFAAETEIGIIQFQKIFFLKLVGFKNGLNVVKNARDILILAE